MNQNGSLTNESTKFMIMNQKLYAKKLGIPWGFSESAYYMKDLNGNYQYKAIGIPWLGLKRGLDEDIVVSSYASIMALKEEPKEVLQNIKKIEKLGMYDKYGFYESIDFTPIRMPKGKKEMVVKTYMAHHQGLILLSINNFFNNNILQKRFSNNPEIAATQILLEETMPEKRIITSEEKKKPEKIKYHDYENYAQRIYTKSSYNLPICNVISSDDYSIVTNVKGEGYSKYKNYFINKFISSSNENQGIFFYMKNIQNKRIWTINSTNDVTKADKYEISFSEDKNRIKRVDGPVESICNTTIIPNNPVEIRELKLINHSNEDETIEVTTTIEPILDSLESYISHPAFKNMFLVYEYDRENNLFIIKRKDRSQKNNELYLAISFFTKDETFGELEYEIDKAKFQGRTNFGLPDMVENSRPFSNKIDFTINPILALRKTITIKKEQEVTFNLLLSVNEDKQKAIQNIKEYMNEEKIKKAFELSKAKADTEARYLGLNASQIETYQKMIAYILFKNGIQSKKRYIKEYYPKEELWKYGISGDLPILAVKIKDSIDIEVLQEVLKAYEFYRLKNIELDLVIINEEQNSYEKYTKEAIQNTILNANMSYLQNIRGGIFVIENGDEIIEAYAKLIIDTRKGPLKRQIKDLEDEHLEKEVKIGARIPEKIELYDEKNKDDSILNKDELLYYNEYGGFSSDGKEYIFQVDKNNKLPSVFSNIMANDKFGTLVTDNFGGFTWSKNSRLNKITSFSNNQVTDEPSEMIFVQDEKTLKNLFCLNNGNKYKVSYGFGYTNYEQKTDGIESDVLCFVPNDDSVKITLITLKNNKPIKRKLNLIYYSKLVLGEDEIKNSRFIDINFCENSNLILVKNKTNTDFKEITYFSCSEKIKSYTGDRDFFIGDQDITKPSALNKVSLNNYQDASKNEILAYQIEIELEAFENKEIVFLLGAEENKVNCQDMAYKYGNISNVKEELAKLKNNWQEKLAKIQVSTPVQSFNILMNGWLVYQTYISRLKARTSFYQCGGAFGFRDQLQDTIALKYFSPDVMKDQIIKHSRHQFCEGDVEHWWHEETKRGIRTRFSDDLLWLVYIVEDYISYTNDYSILEIETPYLQGEELQNGIDEKYDLYEESSLIESIYKHCLRALNKGLNFGKNGLCKIGSGDWNDGFSNVGNKGEGESVWLSFFTYDILRKWIPICEKVGEDEDLINKYKEIMDKLKKNVNNIGWDGRWYRRAFTDDGNILGSLQNEECKIDGIAQSWAVISNAGDNDKKYISMESLENHLVDTENGIIKLLDPPFEKSILEPGYIKGYLPGTRENGGQYTHAAIWAIIAQAKLGFGEKAVEWFRMINPIEHTKTKEAQNKYKIEPYVVPADIYGAGNLAGRGGWSWYTGSSSWMYEAGFHYILGLTVENGYLSINPSIPKDWKEYKIHFKYNESIYNIYVKNPNGKNTGVEQMKLNGSIIEEKRIKLQANNSINEVEITM